MRGAFVWVVYARLNRDAVRLSANVIDANRRYSSDEDDCYVTCAVVGIVSANGTFVSVATDVTIVPIVCLVAKTQQLHEILFKTEYVYTDVLPLTFVNVAGGGKKRRFSYLNCSSVKKGRYLG